MIPHYSAALFRQASEYGVLLDALLQSVALLTDTSAPSEIEAVQMIAADAGTLTYWADRLQADAGVYDTIPVAAIMAGFRVARTLQGMHADPTAGPVLALAGVQKAVIDNLAQTFAQLLNRASAAMKTGMRA